MKQVISILFTFTPLLLASQTRFNNLFDYKKQYESGIASIELANGDYISVVKTVGSNYSDNKLLVLRLNAFGEVLNQNEIYKEGYIYYSGLDCFRALSDGTFLIGGAYKEISTDATRACLIKIDTAGQIIWQKTFGTSNGSNTDIKDLRITEDEDVVFCGYSNRFDASGNIYAVKTTRDGKIIWERDFGGTGWQNAFQIAPTPDGGFVLATMNGNQFVTHYSVIKLDSLGYVLWQKGVGGPYSDGVMPRITALQDGSSLFAGATGTADGGLNAYIANLSPNGDILWQKNYPGEFSTYFFTRPIVLPNGEFVLSGGYYTKPGIGGGGQLLLAKIGPSGEILWLRRHYFLPDKSHYGYALKETKDGGFFTTGFTNDTTQDAWFLKVDSLGCLEENCAMASSVDPAPSGAEVSLSVYPNPFSDQVFVESPEDPILSITIRSMAGKILEESRPSVSAGVYAHQLNTGHYPPGAYFVTVKTTSGTNSKMILKL